MNRNQEQFLNKVASKTQVRKEDIVKLANDFQTKDLASDQNLRDLIQQVALLSGKTIPKVKEDEIIALVKKEPTFKNKL